MVLPDNRVASSSFDGSIKLWYPEGDAYDVRMLDVGLGMFMTSIRHVTVNVCFVYLQAWWGYICCSRGKLLHAVEMVLFVYGICGLTIVLSSTLAMAIN